MSRIRHFLSISLLLLLGIPTLGATQIDPITGQPIQAENPDTPPPPAPTAAGPKSPRELIEAFQEDMEAYAETKEPEDLDRAGRRFDLSDIMKGDQDYVADTAARDLSNFFARASWAVNPIYLPRETDESQYSLKVTYRVDGRNQEAEILLERGADGVWRFAPVVRQQATELFTAVQDQEPVRGRGAISDATTWIRDNVPVGLRERGFILEHWQWLGLLALILLGVIASVLARVITMSIRAYFMKKRGVEAESRGWRRSRPFGITTMAAVWYFGLRYLLLPEQIFFAVMLATRLVLMVGTTWALCSVIDYVTEFMAVLASRTKTRIDDVVVPMVQRVLKIFVITVGIIWIADNMNINVKALLAGLGIGGIALALAAKDTVENFFGAVSILTDRPFEVGDWIVMSDIEGTVEAVGFRSTQVRTFYNSLITVPNALMTRATIDNLGAREYRRVKTTLGLTYDTPPDRIEAFCEGVRELIRRHPYTRKDYYHVYFNGYGASSLDILLYTFLKTPDWATELREKQRLFLDILRLARELGVEFAFPTQTLRMLQSAEAEPPEGFSDVHSARSRGRQEARDIVDQFTGARVPPPVRIAKDARDDSADGDGDG